uniref:Ribonuclease H protein At1g65750 family n=1 Tax=Cajanus cajan TaxID=3821 RepID=A0A151RYW1_CAJCA|nr:Putative ribonuclease H protein At1g65750 family [Cajanus cajan]
MEGECNSKYFDFMVNGQRRKTTLRGININDRWVEEHNTIKEEIKQFFFQKRFQKEVWIRSTLDGVTFEKIKKEENNMLSSMFKELEVKDAMLECGIIKSLGMPIGANPSRETTWRPMIDKYAKKLSSCLSSGVVSKIDSIQRGFLWGYTKGQRKVPWMSWKSMCCLRNHGGLGFKDLKAFNEEPLTKWRWNVFHRKNTLWDEVLTQKYGGWKGMLME